MPEVAEGDSQEGPRILLVDVRGTPEVVRHCDLVERKLDALLFQQCARCLVQGPELRQLSPVLLPLSAQLLLLLLLLLLSVPTNFNVSNVTVNLHTNRVLSVTVDLDTKNRNVLPPQNHVVLSADGLALARHLAGAVAHVTLVHRGDPAAKLAFDPLQNWSQV